jgi:hypothetical protein
LIAISRHLFARSAVIAAAGHGPQTTMMCADRIVAVVARKKSVMMTSTGQVDPRAEPLEIAAARRTLNRRGGISSSTRGARQSDQTAAASILGIT